MFNSRTFLFPEDQQIELEDWAVTGEFSNTELHQMKVILYSNAYYLLFLPLADLEFMLFLFNQDLEFMLFLSNQDICF